MRTKLGTGGWIALFLILLSSVAPASAAAAPELLWEAPEAGSQEPSEEAGHLQSPQGIGASPVNGHIYVADYLNNRISESTSWGLFVRAWGWGVADGSTDALQSCTTTCFEGLAGAGAGQIFHPIGVAVDSTGAVYVLELVAEDRFFGEEDYRVQKFDGEGHFILMFGGKVNKTTGGNVCTAASGDECGAGVPGTGDGEFAATFVTGPRLAVGPDDTVYVGDVGRIQEFNPSGVYVGEIATSGETIKTLTVDPDGNVYASFASTTFETKDDVARFDSAGSPDGVLEVAGPGALAADAEGNIYVVSDPFQKNFGVPEVEPRVVEFDPAGNVLISPEELFAQPSRGNRAQPLYLSGLVSNVLGDGTDAPGDLYVSVSDIGADYKAAYGPLPQFEPAPERPPKIQGQSAGPVGSTTASVSAEINPRFFASTTYYVEYGTTPCDAGGCTTLQPLPPGDLLHSNRNAFTRTQPIELEGLTPGTTYFVRFVAISGEFTTTGEGEDELEATFTTFRSGFNGLLDKRAYELVSPPDKENGEVGSGQSSSGLVTTSVAPQQASPDGGGLTYTSFTAFGPDPNSAPAASQYLSKRTENGWVTNNITPADRESFLSDPLRGFSPDLAWGAIIQVDPPLVEGAPPGFENLYVQHNDDETVELVSGPEPQISIPKTTYCVGFGGATDDFDHVLLTARGSLTEDAPAANGQNLYEWVRGEGLRLVSILTSGSPAPPTNTTAFGAAGNECRIGGSIMRNAISADGSKIFWTRGTTPTQLMARVNGSETIQLDKIQGGVGPAGSGQFWAASDDGSVVYFTAGNKLTPGAGSNDLYRYDFNLPAGARLTNISKEGAVQGVLGASDDGAYVYFAANGVLDAGEGPTGETAQAGQPNLYLWHEGEGARFIAVLKQGLASTGDVSDWSSSPSTQSARVTPDGTALAFLSRRSLTGYDNRGQADNGAPVSELFLYDSGEDELRCASCNPTGSRPLGGTSVSKWWTPYEQVRYLSDGGNRLFFESEDALDPRDVNGKRDVYEYERAGAGDCTEGTPTYAPESEGCSALISTGTQPAPAFLTDASSSGSDVFFSTPQRLVGWDTDDRYDIYDARTGGGFPEPPPISEPCEGEACRSAIPATPAAPPTPPSSQVNGAGNVKEKAKPKHCKKGQRKVKKKGKTRCVRKKAGKANKKGRAGK